jgi:hypothetical protein
MSNHEQMYFVFFAKDNGLCVWHFLSLEAAKEGCDELKGYVTCIVPVSINETLYWNGRHRQNTERSVKQLWDELVLAQVMEMDGFKLDTTKENREGHPTLRRARGN